MVKIKKKKSNKKNNKYINIIDILIFIAFFILTLLLIINLIKLSNIETLLRIIVSIILSIILIITFIFKNKKKILFRILMIILSLIYIFINYAFYRVYSSLDNITSNVETKGICLVTNSSDIESIDNIRKDDIAVVAKDLDEDFYNLAKEVLEEKDKSNKLIDYEGYFEIINALLNKEIEYAFLPENYNEIYRAGSSEEELQELDFKVLYTKQKVIENKKEDVPVKMLDEPFTMLLMGTDVILDSYNADTLMVLSVNPKTLKVTMLSIPRDTYATIACTGGKHKINASGWYGDSCVVKTVSKYLGVDIDYYAKINFLGIVDLVDTLGGVEVDVPYSLCEQNSRREFGSSMVFVDEGLQTLNGEQALALSRNRHYWKGMCPAKYTSDGNRSDLTRGQNQQLVIKAIVSKLLSVRDLNQFYDILDTVGDNMSTNMSKETILSFYNVGKSIVKKFNTSNTDELVNIEKLTFKSYFANIYLSGMQLSTIVNYNESIKHVSNQMKKNLGLEKVEVIKDVSFDINDEYDPDAVKFNKLTTSVELLPNFAGKTLKEATNYCSNKNLKCESNSNSLNSIIVSQSISENSDISTIRGKTITFGVEVKTIEETNKPSLDNKTPANSTNKNDEDENTKEDSSAEDKDKDNGNNITKEEENKDTSPKEDEKDKTLEEDKKTPSKEENEEETPSTSGDNNKEVGGSENE